MLIKALLTGSILSLLAGSIVYYGTEGAIADVPAENVAVTIDATELAGGEVELEEVITSDKNPERDSKQADRVAEVEVDQDATVVVEKASDAEGPKTKWLDQYLKSDEPVKETSEDVSQPDITAYESEILAAMESKNPKADESDPPKSDKPSAKSTREDILRIMSGAKQRPEKDKESAELVEKEEGSQSDILPAKEVKKPREFKRAKPKTQNLPRSKSNYSLIVEEANKIEIPDLRDQAMLEIIDYALDRRHTGQAADIVAELSSPELRDTARARIGVSLANMNEAEAAFAVMDEIEIDELASPIRLEIISALMATRAERAQKKSKFSE